MTVDPDVLDDIADVANNLTPAKIAALKARADARLDAFEAGQAQIDALEAETATYVSATATANAAIATATAAASTKATSIANLQAQVTALQAQIAENATPATAADVAERDQVVALATEVGVTIP